MTDRLLRAKKVTFNRQKNLVYSAMSPATLITINSVWSTIIFRCLNEHEAIISGKAVIIRMIWTYNQNTSTGLVGSSIPVGMGISNLHSPNIPKKCCPNSAD